MSLTTAYGELHTGKVLRWSRAYTASELDSYGALSGRVAPEGKPARLPDLLVVAPLTKIGGDLDYIARKMTWSHTRPVETTERLTAELEIVALTEDEGFHRIAFDSRIRTDRQDVVLSGHSKGIILKGQDGQAASAPPEAGDETPAGPGRPAADAALLDRIAPDGTLTATTTVTAADIARCAALTGDRGVHHTLGLAGRQMAQGLLTASTVPLLRGDADFHFRSVSMVFLQPVYAGDTIESTLRVTEVDDTAARTVRAAASVRNADGTEVMVTEVTGCFPAA